MSDCSSFFVTHNLSSIAREFAFFAAMASKLLRKRNIGLFIKVVIALVALWFIYREVQLKDQDTDLSFGIGFLLKPAQLPDY